MATMKVLLVVSLLYVLHTSLSAPITSDMKVKSVSVLIEPIEQKPVIDSEEKLKRVEDLQVKSLSSGMSLGSSLDAGKVQQHIRRTRSIMDSKVKCAEGMIERIGRCWTPEQIKKMEDDER